jgi:hypothetical protein
MTRVWLKSIAARQWSLKLYSLIKRPWQRGTARLTVMDNCLQVSFRQSPSRAMRKPDADDTPPLQGIPHLAALETGSWVPPWRCCHCFLSPELLFTPRDESCMLPALC